MRPQLRPSFETPRDNARLLRMRGELSIGFSNCLFRPAAKIVDQTTRAAWLARKASVAAVQDQPVMGVQHEFRRDHALEPQFHFQRRLALRQPRAVTDAEYMRIHRHGTLTEGHVEND